MLLIVCRLIVYTRIIFSQTSRLAGMMAETINSQFGKIIRELRLAKGLSQEELAFKAGVHRTYLGGIERGERNPALENINALAKALDTSLSELFMFGIKKKQ